MGMTSKQTSPHGAMIIWNYSDRITSDGATDVNKVQEIMLNTVSVISMNTNKTKSSPTGSFEVHLAPIYNWISRITPGSWCVLLMTKDVSIPDVGSSALGKADRRMVKMLGRIHDVRLAVSVDGEGTRRSEYVITGQDWGSVFETNLYVDPIVRNNIGDTPIGQASRFIYGNQIIQWTQNDFPLPTSSNSVTAIIDVWGAPIAGLGVESLTSGGSNPIKVTTDFLSSKTQFTMPSQVAKYFGFGSGLGGSVSMGGLIKQGFRDGVLTGLDKYGGDNQDSYGIIDPVSIFGVHTFWQLMVDNSNTVINELVTDMRWEGNKPLLGLYKRARPFINRKKFKGTGQKEVDKNISLFSNVRRITIPLEDVLNINAGTNWRDKINFVEVRPLNSLGEDTYENQVKLEMMTFDALAYQREGFKPLIQTANYMPLSKDAISALNATQWKNLLREWHFNTHLMLNGSMTIIGQNDYIQVGDNVMVNAQILGSTNGVTPMSKDEAGAKDPFLLAHVESVSHAFGVDQESGARSFTTTIQFVRGVITDKNGKLLGSSDGGIDIGFDVGSFVDLSSVGGGSTLTGAIDANATDLANAKKKNVNTLITPTANDPAKGK